MLGIGTAPRFKRLAILFSHLTRLHACKPMRRIMWVFQAIRFGRQRHYAADMSQRCFDNLNGSVACLGNTGRAAECTFSARRMALQLLLYMTQGPRHVFFYHAA